MAMDGEEKAVMLAAQVEEQAMQLPELEEALRVAQQRSNEQRGSVAQVQQQIQVLAADQRNIEEQSRNLNARQERLSADKNALAAPDDMRLNNLKEQLQEAQAHAEVTKRLNWKNCKPMCLCSTKPRRRRTTSRERRASQASRFVGPFGSPQSLARKSADRRQAQALAEPSTAWTVCKLCGAAFTSKQVGKTPSKPPCVNAWRRLKCLAWTSCAPSKPMHRLPSWLLHRTERRSARRSKRVTRVCLTSCV